MSYMDLKSIFCMFVSTSNHTTNHQSVDTYILKDN